MLGTWKGAIFRCQVAGVCKESHPLVNPPFRGDAANKKAKQDLVQQVAQSQKNKQVVKLFDQWEANATRWGVAIRSGCPFRHRAEPTQLRVAFIS